MASQKSVWVLDINDYLLYLEACLDRLVLVYPWLGDHQPIDRHWHWQDAQRIGQNPTQRSQLIDWIIEREIYDVFYLNRPPSTHHPDFQVIHNHLVVEFDLNLYTGRYLFIPKFYGDTFTQNIHRQSCWLYIECEIDKPRYSDYALSAITSARRKE